jgi:carbon monoxide dehydrogenase subunit G
MMHVDGSYRAAVASEELWAALSDPVRLGEALPEVGAVDVVDADRFSASVRPATNLGVTPLRLDVHIAERAAGERVRIVGDGAGGEHRVAFDVELRLTPRGSDGCEVAWRAGVQAYGVLASLTQRVLPALLRDQVTLALRVAENHASNGSGDAA